MRLVRQCWSRRIVVWRIGNLKRTSVELEWLTTPAIPLGSGASTSTHHPLLKWTSRSKDNEDELTFECYVAIWRQELSDTSLRLRSAVRAIQIRARGDG